jgi:hypothetical protein
VPNWSSRIGAKIGPVEIGPVELVPNLGLLPTHKYWMALACAKIKIFKNESKAL